MSRNKHKKNMGNNTVSNSNYQSNYKNNRNRNKKYKLNQTRVNQTNRYYPTYENELVRRVQSQPGIGNHLVLFSRDNYPHQILNDSVCRIQGTLSVKQSREEPTKFQLKINNVVYAEAFCQTLAEAKKTLSELALTELQKVCFTIVRKIRVKDLPKVELSSTEEKKSSSLASGIGAKMMEKMGWSGQGLGSQEQGRTDIVKAHFNINRQGLGTKNISEEVWAVLEEYSASQDLNSIAFTPDFTKDERAVIHAIACKLNLKSRSSGKGEDRFLIVENKIQPWNLVDALLEAGGENEQFKLITPTNFL